MSDADSQVDTIASEILAYLERRPLAADSLAGVVQAWLGRGRSVQGDRLAEHAVARLVAAGQLEAIQGPNGQLIYRRPQNAPRRPTGPQG
jgi:hypothetical protein